MISVVVPIYNVEEFLGECLRSVEAQTVADLEIVLVDDGSTDGSVAIAQEFVGRDPRFKLVSQENAGLSAARNTGTAEASGEFLVFLDSDDVLPPNAYELLLGALTASGSDFATGNVHRLTRMGTAQSPFLARAFAETRLKTHVTDYRPLIADRVAWNKLWRREFWDRHGFRFPEGRLFEDAPVTVPAHFLAKSVDVISEPVYYWRIREGGDLSITQRRLDPDMLLDRLQSISDVRDHLDRTGHKKARRWYDESIVADDLRYYLNALEGADDEFMALFLDRVNALLDTASPKIYDPLPAIERLKWHMVRHRLVPELSEVLRFAKQDLPSTPPVRVRGKWYGDYPFRTDGRLKVPSSVYRLEGELTLRATLDTLEPGGDGLRIAGTAYVTGIGAAAEGAQRVQVAALRPGRLRRVRLVTSALKLPTRPVRRPEVTAEAPQGLREDVSWSGFEATLDPVWLKGRRGWDEGPWEVYVTVRAAGLKRRRSKFLLGAPLQAVRLQTADGIDVDATVTEDAELSLTVAKQSATIVGARQDGETLELELALREPPGKTALVAEGDGRSLRHPLKAEGGTYVARVPLGRLRGEEEVTAWDLRVGRTPVWPAAGRWISGDREVALAHGPRGAALVEREAGAVVTGARFHEDGTLELDGDGLGALELLHVARGERHSLAGAFNPAAVPGLAGPLPLAEGLWELRDPGPVTVAGELTLPIRAVVGHKAFELQATDDHRLVLDVERDLDDDERGPYHQRRLRSTAYEARRGGALRDAVVFSSFLGRQYSDSPRAIHEELVRRGTPLEHLWVVRDGQAAVPDTATVLREGSREYHEALATARYVVTNDHFPDWFQRRDDQVCLQTWHGTPLKRLGFDVSDLRKTVRRFERHWERQVSNWQYVLSPNRFSTPILRRAYAIEGEMVETGYPRVDVLAGADRDARAAGLRRRLGIPAGVRTVLYAPTYRDQVTDRRGRFRLDLRLDLERLRAAVGDDTVILFRKHHYVVDAAPATADGFVRDVSSYPDGTELLLAADVLVTDYSSMMVDFANTGRPMLFYTYDLDAYADEIRGFYLDFVASVPGPLLKTTDEVADALRDLEGVRAAHADRYRAFQETFCELDDGRAAERVVDRLLDW